MCLLLMGQLDLLLHINNWDVRVALLDNSGAPRGHVDHCVHRRWWRIQLEIVLVGLREFGSLQGCGVTSVSDAMVRLQQLMDKMTCAERTLAQMRTIRDTMCGLRSALEARLEEPSIVRGLGHKPCTQGSIFAMPWRLLPQCCLWSTSL